ncbi:uncharacterized protein [Dysidea avara]|uniref:uncharacterized protein n=1 Tax=Dysidea avara TaxID=196820 RepID=UPI00331B032F
MDDTQRLRVKRRSCKASITKLLAKVEDATSCELSTINLEVVTDSRRLAVATTLAQLKTKKDAISKLNDDISEAIQNVETELTDADIYIAELEEKIAVLEEFIKKAYQPPVTQRAVSHTLTSHPPLVATTPSQMPETKVVKKPIHSAATDLEHVSADSGNLPIHTSTPARDPPLTFSRLPKLTLPTFNGNPLQWQPFWDSFTAGVDSNPNLTHAQKFAYLRAQLEGDASHVTAGFPLTDNNYLPAVTLLQERFGQRYNIIDAHLEALLHVTPPINTLNSLQSFHDTIQSHR